MNTVTVIAAIYMSRLKISMDVDIEKIFDLAVFLAEKYNTDAFISIKSIDKFLNVRDIVRLERQFLHSLDYNLWVTTDQFSIMSMMIARGLFLLPMFTSGKLNRRLKQQLTSVGTPKTPLGIKKTSISALKDITNTGTHNTSKKVENLTANIGENQYIQEYNKPANYTDTFDLNYTQYKELQRADVTNEECSDIEPFEDCLIDDLLSGNIE